MLLDDVASYLVAQSGIVSASWPLYKGYIPDETAQVIALFETGGLPSDTLGGENERVTFMARVRGARLDYQVVRLKWKDVFDALHDSRPAAGYAYVHAVTHGPLVFSDPSGRINMTANFNVMKSRT